ncbi:MAG: hypothetical protein ACE5GX_10285 [Thermoanaerobaculia bacterium]
MRDVSGRTFEPPESSLSPADHLLRGAWTVLTLAWSVVCVVQAVDRLDALASGATYPWRLALADATYWLRPMLALGAGGFLAVLILSRGRSPGLTWRNVLTPVIAVLSSCFAWAWVLLTVRLFDAS